MKVKSKSSSSRWRSIDRSPRGSASDDDEGDVIVIRRLKLSLTVIRECKSPLLGMREVHASLR
jgi:hypothetical protein